MSQAVAASETGTRLGDARNAEAKAERAVVDDRRSPCAWYWLGRVRLDLARGTAIARGGEAMPIGVSYAVGAIEAFVAGLRDNPSDSLLADALAHTPAPVDDARTLRDMVTALRRARPTLAPAAMLATARLEHTAGHRDAALALAERALASGQVDSGVASLVVARELYGLGRSDAGRTVLLRGAETGSRAAAAAYREQIGWVADSSELAEWDALPADRRANWLAEFWSRRDIAAGQPDGARLIEHYERIEYAFANFAVVLPQTGPQRFLTSSSTDDGGYTYAMNNPDCFPLAARMGSLDATIGSHPSWRDAPVTQYDVDDRGVIWIRHGAPTKRLVSLGTQAVEVWRYDDERVPFSVYFRQVDFSGTSAASTLVATLLTMPEKTRDEVCDGDRNVCTGAEAPTPMPSGADFTSRRVTPGCTPRPEEGVPGAMNAAALIESKLKVDPGLAPEAIRHAHDSGMKEIRNAETTDAYPRSFRRALDLRLQVAGLVRLPDASGRMVVAFAVPLHELAMSTGDSSPRRVRVQVMVLDGHATRTDVDTVEALRSGNGDLATAVIEIPLRPRTYLGAVVVSQSDDRGVVAPVPPITVPPGDASIALSDVVLGREGSGVAWNSGTHLVAFDPVGRFSQADHVSLYAQVFGLPSGDRYRAELGIFRADDQKAARSLVQVGFDELSRGPVAELTHSLSFENLPPGEYRLRLIVSRGDAQAISSTLFTVTR